MRFLSLCPCLMIRTSEDRSAAARWIAAGGAGLLALLWAVAAPAGTPQAELPTRDGPSALAPPHGYVAAALHENYDDDDEAPAPPRPEADDDEAPAPPRPEADDDEAPAPPRPEADDDEAPAPPRPEADDDEEPGPPPAPGADDDEAPGPPPAPGADDDPGGRRGLDAKA